MSENQKIHFQFEDDQQLEFERYELREAPIYSFAVDRREFAQALGAGLMILVFADLASGQSRGRRARRTESLSERLHISEGGVVTVLTSKVEVGQGSRTELSQAAAEELRLPIDRIRIVMADTSRCPDDGGTAGSRTTPSTVPRVRNACAAARERLIDLAAVSLGVESDAISYDAGEFNSTSGVRISLAELVKGANLEEVIKGPPQESVEIRQVSNWKVLGKPAKKVGGVEIVTGQHRYPSDIQLPGMLYGKVLRPPSYGAKLTSVDLSSARAMEGVTGVRDGDFIGCTAETSFRAGLAIGSIAATATWQESPQISSADLFTHLKNTASGDDSRRGRGGNREWGNLETAVLEADRQIQSTYEIAYIQHAPMEPRAAVAQWEEGRLTVWTGTQQPSRVEGELRQAFRLGDEQVRVIVPDTGGGFGGKHTGEAAIEAARLAKAAMKPVSLRWTREEEFTWAYFRPAGVIEVQAALDTTGQLVSWDFTNYNAGGSGIQTPYQVANGRTRVLASDSPLRQGSYRALASTANTFARESAMDELAELAGEDPLAFRLKHLQPGRLRNVLLAAAKRFNWQQRRQQQRAVGIACGTEKGSYVAACVEVEVNDDRIKILSICQAFECGAILNPQNLQSQVEGCLVMGLGGALTEAIQFENGKIANSSFYDYQVPRMSDLPEMDLVLLNRADLPSVGAGETPIIAIAPAIAGAVATATHRRHRTLPLRV